MSERIQSQPAKATQIETVKSWLHYVEPVLFNGLAEYAKVLGGKYGFEGFRDIDDKPIFLYTGAYMCFKASTLIYIALSNKFQLDNLEVISQTVNVFHKISNLDSTTNEYRLHNRIRFKEADKKYFVDIAYGQINPKLNRIIFDSEDNAKFYYQFGIDDTYHPFLKARNITANCIWFHQRMSKIIETRISQTPDFQESTHYSVLLKQLLVN